MSANCTNTEGSFTCQCITGYYGDGCNCTGEFLSRIHVRRTRSWLIKLLWNVALNLAMLYEGIHCYIHHCRLSLVQIKCQSLKTTQRWTVTSSIVQLSKMTVMVCRQGYFQNVGRPLELSPWKFSRIYLNLIKIILTAAAVNHKGKAILRVATLTFS